MRPLLYSINVTLDGCCDHREVVADEDLHRHAAENLDRADALLFGRVTYEMMEAAWRLPAQTGTRPDWMEPWMEPFARTIDAAKKYVVSSTLERVDWNAKLVRGDLRKAVQQLKREPGKGLFVGGVAQFQDQENQTPSVASWDVFQFSDGRLVEITSYVAELNKP
jgi:dihydrofolate reductase